MGLLIHATLTSKATGVPPQALGVLAAVGQVARAEGRATLISDPARRSAAHLAIAKALLRMGRPQHADLTLKQALAAAYAIPDDQRRADALGNMAVALAQAGLADPALAAAQAILDNQQRADALGKVAVALANAGQADPALAAARAIPYRWQRANVLGEVAAALAQAGQAEQALARRRPAAA